MKAGFAEIDITPPIGTRKIGWLKVIIGEQVHDPLYARAAVLESGGKQVAFVQLDTLCIRGVTVNEIRRRLEAEHHFPAGNVMVAATHNHAGPAVSDAGDVVRDEAYCATLVDKVVQAFGKALASRQEAEAGFGRTLNWTLAKNRRVIMRGGTVKTHGRFDDPDALCLEGPIDPEVVVLAVRGRDGKLLGALVNYSCHPTHFGGEPIFSAGWPGVMANVLKQAGCPMPMFLNGAQGNTHHIDPVTGQDTPMEACGQMLAASTREALGRVAWRKELKLGAARRMLQLPFREATPDQIHGTAIGAQRFIDPAIYERVIPKLLEEIKRLGRQEAEVQALFIDDHAFVSMPGELFVELGLKIKEHAHPVRACVVALANGIVGYLPTREAFTRGGYETTFATSSKLAPEAGELLVAAALDLLRSGAH